jgi:multicomponent Na+:H+ antiporter subunit E
MKRWPAIGFGLAVLWLFVRGVTLEPATVAGEFVIGLLVGVPLAFLTRRFYTDSYPAGQVIGATPYIVGYVALFAWELLTANIDVARRVLSPSMPIDPTVVEIPLRVETDLAITTIANSITLTPGTLSMDYDDERNSLYVHALAAGDRAAVVDPVRNWEDYALRIFDEDRDPSSAVPHKPDDHAFENRTADPADPGEGGDDDGE